MIICRGLTLDRNKFSLNKSPFSSKINETTTYGVRKSDISCLAEFTLEIFDVKGSIRPAPFYCEEILRSKEVRGSLKESKWLSQSRNR